MRSRMSTRNCVKSASSSSYGIRFSDTTVLAEVDDASTDWNEFHPIAVTKSASSAVTKCSM